MCVRAHGTTAPFKDREVLCVVGEGGRAGPAHGRGPKNAPLKDPEALRVVGEGGRTAAHGGGHIAAPEDLELFCFVGEGGRADHAMAVARKPRYGRTSSCCALSVKAVARIPPMADVRKLVR